MALEEQTQLFSQLEKWPLLSLGGGWGWAEKQRCYCQRSTPPGHMRLGARDTSDKFSFKVQSVNIDWASALSWRLWQVLQIQWWLGGHGQCGLDTLMGKVEVAQLPTEKDNGIEGVCVWPEESGEGRCYWGGLLWRHLWKWGKTEEKMSR